MELKNISVVLCRPEESRNIGSVCRAMANSDIFDLRIVGKSGDYDAEKIRTLAIHAFDIWQNAKFFNSITDATSDCFIAAGTTRRRGKKRKEKLFFPEEFVNLVQNASGKVALVFGNERTGLTDAELAECTVGVAIPSAKNFSSLNLSHAVQILCYEFFRKSMAGQKGFSPVALDRIDDTVKNLTDNLASLGFFKVAGRSDMEKFWRSVFSRAALSESEAKYIEKTFDKISGLAKKT